MVKDEICNTYLPKEEAIAAKFDGKEYFFCSKECHQKFLEQKNKVKFTVQFRGRELAYKEFGDKLMDRIEEKLEDIAKVEGEKKFEGRSLTMTMCLK